MQRSGWRTHASRGDPARLPGVPACPELDWPEPIFHVPLLPGDCAEQLRDINEARSAVGFGYGPPPLGAFPPGPMTPGFASGSFDHALGYNLAPPYPPGIFDLSSVLPVLRDADGIADNGFIIGTDTVAGQVYVLL
jgi:hypothetical protein